MKVTQELEQSHFRGMIRNECHTAMCSSENEEKKEGQKRENSHVYFWSRRIEKWMERNQDRYFSFCYVFRQKILYHAGDNDGKFYYTEER